MSHQVVIISGGAESVSLSLAEWAWRYGVPYSVLSLVPNSILRGASGCRGFHSVWEPAMDLTNTAIRLADALAQLGHDDELLVLPSEDDGLYLMNNLRAEGRSRAHFSRARALRMGGMDKCELFEYLGASGYADHLANSMTLNSLDDFNVALRQFGSDLVVKPAFKPWKRSIGKGGLKVITRRPHETLENLKMRLACAWPTSSRWIAQRRLSRFGVEERSACIVRGDRVVGRQVSELMKYPHEGGSAVWVHSSVNSDLLETAAELADAIDLVGMCELTFLKDDAGRPRLIELNTRPWLQFELLERSGFPVVAQSLKALQGMPLDTGTHSFVETHWFHAERMIMSLIAGDAGPRSKTLSALLRIRGEPKMIAVWGSQLPGARGRWFMRNLRRVISMT